MDLFSGGFLSEGYLRLFFGGGGRGWGGGGLFSGGLISWGAYYLNLQYLMLSSSSSFLLL